MSVTFPIVGAVAAPRILIVDDDVGTIRLLAQAVRNLGEVVFATGGADAVAAARAERPDLVLLDAEMQDMDGFQTCAALRSLPGMTETPILFITSHSGVGMEVRALEAGAVDFIGKPFHPLIVEARARAHLTLKLRSDALLRLATMDGLTGIANRRAFDGALSQEVRRLARGTAALSLILYDVDHFKRYNDHYGHQAGDDCLRAVAAALAGASRRAGELVARFGGEEFAILLPGSGPNGALALAEKARRAVSGLALPHADRPDGVNIVTVSAGVASLDPLPDDAPDDLAAALVGAADRAMYRAKALGRDRVVHATQAH